MSKIICKECKRDWIYMNKIEPNKLDLSIRLLATASLLYVSYAHSIIHPSILDSFTGIAVGLTFYSLWRDYIA